MEDGHAAGVEALVKVVERAVATEGVAALTVFALSIENASRDKSEVAALWRTMSAALTQHIIPLQRAGVRVCMLPPAASVARAMPASLVARVAEAEAMTTANRALVSHLFFCLYSSLSFIVRLVHSTQSAQTLSVAIGHGGKQSMVAAVRKLAAEVKTQRRSIDSIEDLALSQAAFGKLCISI